VKVLFLDVDGVLNSLSWFAAQPPCDPCSVDPKAVKRIIPNCDDSARRVLLVDSESVRERRAPNKFSDLA
jgi:hypothetical protein